VDQGSHLEQAQAQGVELRSAEPGCLGGGLPAQGLHELIGGGMEQEPKEVGAEGRAREPIGLEGVLEVLDVELALPPSVRRRGRAFRDRRARAR